MEKTPQSLRLHIGLFGRTNAGKSSFLNLICGQDIAITSELAGTTTDIVEKAVELLPVGPVQFLDTAGVDDDSALAGKRREKTDKAFDRADIVVCIVEPEVWTAAEESIVNAAKKRRTPVIIVINKVDLAWPTTSFSEVCRKRTGFVMTCSSISPAGREEALSSFKLLVQKALADDSSATLPLIADLLPPGGIAVLVVPIDLQAPRGRLILPQVQTIRDALDGDAAVLVVKEREYAHALKKLAAPPDLVVCDSQVVMKTIADTPDTVACTTFSILFSRYKGDLIEQVRGLAAINKLHPGSKVLIAEACSHHALADDIGRVKIPRWLRQYTGVKLTIDMSSGRDYPDNLTDYALIIHCGSCMLTRRETKIRLEKAAKAGVPITNYGLCIAMIQGVLKRALSPFPAALDAFEHRKDS